MSEDPKPAMNLDPEMLAAYIDKRLTPEQRAAVEAQLASDPDSYAVLVESMKALDALDGQQRTVPFVVKKKTPVARWTIAAGVIAAAAALLLVVVRPLPWHRAGGDEDRLVTRLVAAVGDNRNFDARVTGGFHYAPVQPVLRGPETSSPRTEVLVARGEIEQVFGGSKSPEARHVLALAEMQTADYRAAASTLDGLCPSARSAAMCSDAAAAFIARADLEHDPSMLAVAEQLVEEAIRLDPRLAEAWFNRALIVEARNPAGAAQAWRDYLAVETDQASGWANEARARMAAGPGRTKP